jgi:hypothetical protein
MSDDQENDDPQLPYTVHETFLGGMLGNVVSRHLTLDEAIVAATARADKSRAIVFRPTTYLLRDELRPR